MPGKTYKLKIGDFEVEGDKAFVSEMLKRYGPQASVEHDATQNAEKARGAKRASTVIRPVGKALSIREFVQQLDLKNELKLDIKDHIPSEYLEQI